MTGNEAVIKVNVRKDTGIRGDLETLGIGVLFSCVLYISLVALSFQVFSLRDLGVSPVFMMISGTLLIGIVSILNLYLGKKFKYGKVFVAALFILTFAVSAFVLREQFTEGLNNFADQISLLREDATGRIQRKFETGGGELSVQVFAAFYAALIAALSYLIAFEGEKILSVLLPVLLIAGIILGIIRPGLILVMVAAALLLVTTAKFLIRNDAFTRHKGVMISSLVLILAAAALTALASFTVGGIDAGKLSVSEMVAGKVHELRYEKYRNPLPEGNMRSVGAFKPTGRVSLMVSMSEPELQYLKGFVGEKYDGRKWSAIGGDFYRDNSGLFYWLHKDGFYVQSQTASLFSFLKAQKPGSMKVENVSACREYKYTPYSLYQKNIRISDERGIGDANIAEDKRNRDMTFEYIPKTTYNSYVLQNEYSSGKLKVSGVKAKELEKYRDSEAAYRNVAYDNYLSIPKEVKKTLKSCLGKEEGLSTSEAKIRILKYLNRNVTYRKEVTSNGSSEIIKWFLTKRKSGYSVHYAAAATMMLRYYGVPSRYVEGFLIPASEAKKIAKNARFSVTEKNAHAWTEYYLSGVGWIPFETVPEYRNSKMYAAAGEPTVEGDERSQGNGDDSGKGGKNNKKKNDDEEKKVSDKTRFDNPINTIRKIFSFRKIWIYLLIGALLLTLITIITIRRIRLYLFTSTFKGEDVRRGTINAFAYGDFLARKGKKSGSGFGASRAAKEINDMALYSTKAISEEQRNIVLASKDEILSRYKAGRNPLEKLYDRAIACVY